MKKFIKTLLIIIVFTFIADRALSFIVKFFYSTATTTDEYKLNTVTFRMDDPVIFMGSSRCHHHYIPSIISDTLQMGVYNAGLWGRRNIYFHYGELCNILKRYTPQTICLELHPIDYLKTPGSDIATVGVLTPFINYTSECDDLLKTAGYYYKCELSCLYRYNSEFANILMGNVVNRSFPANKGFRPLFTLLDTKHDDVGPEKFPFPIDEDKVRCLQAFIDKCKEKNINLIFICSPVFAKEKGRLFDIPNEIARRNGILFINHYYYEGFSGHAEYFADFGHLNETGAKKYSSAIASELKQYIKKK